MSFTQQDQQALSIEFGQNTSLLWATLIFVAWWIFLALSLVCIRQVHLNGEAWCSVLFLCLILRSFWHTGLFVVAHDAMHHSLDATRPRLNRWLGSMALMFYGGLSFKKCQNNHRLHHRLVGQATDPDCGIYQRRPAAFASCEDWKSSNGKQVLIALIWYVDFIQQYVSWKKLLQLVGLWLTLWAITHYFLQLSLLDFVIIWILPFWFSSLQLFIFGTYLPHARRPNSQLPTSNSKQSARNNIRSLYLPEWLSLLCCYHFSLHQEHHAYPHVPWFALPQLRETAPSPTIKA